jgi:hypothetical protein
MPEREYKHVQDLPVLDYIPEREQDHVQGLDPIPYRAQQGIVFTPIPPLVDQIKMSQAFQTGPEYWADETILLDII